ncbi:hypothetical protein PIB30_083147 [Stylosanthes scabra]|uniref:TF-B3 domain-containing protein n=1 Tax=Stylosanthes scabra TaxID=79078 RepID=A0ABU6XSA7_9FABA|nr:hypothetical protein [Stylosanthes scabra]
MNPFHPLPRLSDSCPTFRGIPVMSTKDLEPMQGIVEGALCQDKMNVHKILHYTWNASTKPKVYQENLNNFSHSTRPKGWPCYLVSIVDGLYVVEKPIRYYHLTQYAMNVPRQLLDVAFTHNPKHIIVIDSHSKMFTVRVRTKHKKRRSMVLGRGWKEYQLANDLKKGDVIRMSFNPKYPDHLRCVALKK